ncbi:MAG: DUF5683 domain-containing protein [Bacteroidia bacterium]
MRFTKLKYFLLATFFCAFLFEKTFSAEGNFRPAENDDSLKKVINKDARIASIMSAVLPGLGQIKNKQYWKAPVIYAAIGALGYFGMQKNEQYQKYHKELLYRYSGDTLNQNKDLKTTSTEQINILKMNEKKYRDLFFIGAGAVYLLNILDANVSAHMKTFDVSDKLSMSVRPRAFYCRNSFFGIAGGVSISLNFK